MSATSLFPDALWEAIEPLLPKEPPTPRGGRPRVPDRAALAGIVFVLRTGWPWRLLERACQKGGEQTGPNPVDRGTLGSKYHLVVERTYSWLLGCRRLSVRYERRADLLQGLLRLACALICCRFLNVAW